MKGGRVAMMGRRATWIWRRSSSRRSSPNALRFYKVAAAGWLDASCNLLATQNSA
jgi:hypothetical protein